MGASEAVSTASGRPWRWSDSNWWRIRVLRTPRRRRVGWTLTMVTPAVSTSSPAGDGHAEGEGPGCADDGAAILNDHAALRFGEGPPQVGGLLRFGFVERAEHDGVEGRPVAGRQDPYLPRGRREAAVDGLGGRGRGRGSLRHLPGSSFGDRRPICSNGKPGVHREPGCFTPQPAAVDSSSCAPGLPVHPRQFGAEHPENRDGGGRFLWPERHLRPVSLHLGTFVHGFRPTPPEMLMENHL